MTSMRMMCHLLLCAKNQSKGHMFSCGGSIFDYEKRRGGRERERTRDDDEEDRTSTHQGKVSIYLIYIMCILF